MTAEQYRLPVQYASDLRSSMCAYEDKYGVIDLVDDNISEIVAAGADLIHPVESLEPIHSPLEEDLF